MTIYFARLDIPSRIINKKRVQSRTRVERFFVVCGGGALGGREANGIDPESVCSLPLSPAFTSAGLFLVYPRVNKPRTGGEEVA